MGGPNRNSECKIVPYFSSPLLKYDGEALGNEWSSNNAKWIKRIYFRHDVKSLSLCPGQNCEMNLIEKLVILALRNMWFIKEGKMSHLLQGLEQFQLQHEVCGLLSRCKK